MKTSEFSDLLKSIYQKLEKTIGTKPESCHFILGCSGGPDSVFLFHVLINLKIPFSVVHVNYAKRGLESDKDQSFVEELCSQNQIPIYSFIAPKFSGNFQNQARLYRYKCFEEIRDKQTTDAYILTAHHDDDLAESVFHYIFDSKSIASIKGVKYQKEKTLRPLLGLRAKAIRNFLDDNNIQYRIDKSNSDTHFDRNYLRNRLFPSIEERYSSVPKLAYNILEQSKEHNTAIDWILEKCVINNALDYQLWTKLPQELQLPVLGAWISKHTNRYYPPKKLLFEARKQLLSSTLQNWSMNFDQFLLFNHNERLWIHRKLITKQGIPLIISIDDLKQDKPQIICEEWTFSVSNELASIDVKNAEHLILSVEDPTVLKLRAVESKDRIQHLGMRSGHKRISECLQEAKIPLCLRKFALVLTMKNEVVALLYPKFKNISFGKIGIIANSFKIDSTSKKALIIK